VITRLSTKCGLKRRSGAARLLRLRVQSRSRHGSLSSVIVVCCQVEVSAKDRSLVQSSLTECVFVCVYVCVCVCVYNYV
jgi:hypothetical protein